MLKTILIVDDDLDARAIYRDALENRGYQVLTAEHGAEGVHMARRNKPALILMDIRMPLMNGWQAIGYLRMDRTIAHTQIWAISGHFSEPEEQEQPRRWSFDRLLRKPIDPKELVTEVEKHIGPPLPRPVA